MILGMSTIEFIVLATIVFFIVIIGGVVLGRFLYKKRWNYQYVLLENVAGQGYIPTKRGRCRLINFSKSGTEIYYIKNLNKHRAAYGKRIGKNQIAWAVGSDGYWYNVTFGDLDIRLRQLGVEPIDRDMRYAESQIIQGIEKRYDDRTFIDKYGSMIAFGLFILAIVIVFVGTFIIINKFGSFSSELSETVNVMKEVAQLNKDTLSSIDNIQARSGSGIIPS